MKKNKISTADEAISVIHDGDVMAAAGFVGNGTPEELLIALEKRYGETRSPKNITLLFSSGLGDGKERGLNRLAHRGLFKRVIAGHYGLMPKIGKLAMENEFEAYNLPQGMLTNLYRAVAGKKPGVFSRVDLGTFVDPRIEGGKVNEKATEEVAPGMEIERDILPNMEFEPVINEVARMDPRIFQTRPMGIRPELLRRDIEERIRYNPETNTLRLNFKGLEIESRDDIEIIRKVAEEKCIAAGKKVKAIVDYESFSIGEDLLDAYLEMGKSIIETYYKDVTRHTTSEEMRSKLGDEFVKRGLAPSIYETEEEAETKILI